MNHVNSSNVTSIYLRELLQTRPDPAEQHFVIVDTKGTQVALIYQDGLLNQVQQAERRTVLWKDAGPWDVKVVDVEGDGEVEPSLVKQLKAKGLSAFNSIMTVAEGHVSMLMIDGEKRRLLPAGTHMFWTMGRAFSGKSLSIKQRHIEVQGQEILTRDRVTLRVNIIAHYQVVDPEKVLSSVENYSETLYKSLQLTVRKTLGAMTLDELLEQKVSVDETAADAVRRDMAAIGIDVGEIALKDIILPGEMREIMNKVVTAQKEAEANVIRRREETNATRSLLNTAKVMADNPVMLRLKELEALESIASKVDQLTVTNGTEGLLSDVVKLREP